MSNQVAIYLPIGLLLGASLVLGAIPSTEVIPLAIACSVLAFVYGGYNLFMARLSRGDRWVLVLLMTLAAGQVLLFYV